VNGMNILSLHKPKLPCVVAFTVLLRQMHIWRTMDGILWVPW